MRKKYNATMERDMKFYLDQIESEYMNAITWFDDFNSCHEGYAVILEELDELWEEVKKKRPNVQKLHKEAVQVAAMALRFLMDCINEPPPSK